MGSLGVPRPTGRVSAAVPGLATRKESAGRENTAFGRVTWSAAGPLARVPPQVPALNTGKMSDARGIDRSNEAARGIEAPVPSIGARPRLPVVRMDPAPQDSRVSIHLLLGGVPVHQHLRVERAQQPVHEGTHRLRGHPRSCTGVGGGKRGDGGQHAAIRRGERARREGDGRTGGRGPGTRVSGKSCREEHSCCGGCRS